MRGVFFQCANAASQPTMLLPLNQMIEGLNLAQGEISLSLVVPILIISWRVFLAFLTKNELDYKLGSTICL